MCVHMCVCVCSGCAVELYDQQALSFIELGPRLNLDSNSDKTYTISENTDSFKD